MTFRRQARPSPSKALAEKWRGSVGSSNRVNIEAATISPIRFAKNDRPRTTASPLQAPPMIASNVAALRGSKTAVHFMEAGLTDPSIRVARSIASFAAFVMSRSPGARPAESPQPVSSFEPSLAMASTET